MKYLLYIALLFSAPCFAGTKYTHPTHSGQATANGLTTFGSPVIHGDTVVFTGTFNAYPNLSNFRGLPGDSIVLDFTGAVVTGMSYAQGFWSKMRYTKVVGLRSRDHFGSMLWTDSIRCFRFTQCSAINSVGNYQNGQYWIQLGTSNNAAMQYVANSNDYNKVFDSLQFDLDSVSGWFNAPCINNVNNGRYNLVTSPRFYNIWGRNLTNNTTAAPGFYSGTALNFDIQNIDLDSFQADPSGCRCVHAEWFSIAGYGRVNVIKQKNSYGSFLRVYSATYPEMTAHSSGSVRIENLYFENQIGYAALEGNDQISNISSGLVGLFDLSTIVTTVNHVTLYKSSMHVYNPAHPTTPPYIVWNPGIVDIFHDNMHVYNCMAVSTGMALLPSGSVDTTYEATIGKQIVNTMSRTGSDTLGNIAFKYAVQAGLDSANGPAILVTSPARARSANTSPETTTSFNGVARPGYPNNDVGAWQFQVVGGRYQPVRLKRRGT